MDCTGAYARDARWRLTGTAASADDERVDVSAEASASKVGV